MAGPHRPVAGDVGPSRVRRTAFHARGHPKVAAAAGIARRDGLDLASRSTAASTSIPWRGWLRPGRTPSWPAAPSSGIPTPPAPPEPSGPAAPPCRGFRSVTSSAKVVTVSDGVMAGTREDRSGRGPGGRAGGGRVRGGRAVRDRRRRRLRGRRAGPHQRQFRRVGGHHGWHRVWTARSDPGGHPGDLGAGGARARRGHAPCQPAGPALPGRGGDPGHSIILNTPGSPAGAVECLQAVLDVIPHALDLLGDLPTRHPWPRRTRRGWPRRFRSARRCGPRPLPNPWVGPWSSPRVTAAALGATEPPGGPTPRRWPSSGRNCGPRGHGLCNPRTLCPPRADPTVRRRPHRGRRAPGGRRRPGSRPQVSGRGIARSGRPASTSSGHGARGDRLTAPIPGPSHAGPAVGGAQAGRHPRRAHRRPGRVQPVDHRARGPT